MAVAEAAPGIFPQVILPDGSINSTQNPVARGGIVTLFVTGAGTIPPESVEVRIGTMPAQILWAGPATGIPGLLQVNLRLPSGFFPPGSQAVAFRIGGIGAPPGVFVYLQ